MAGDAPKDAGLVRDWLRFRRYKRAEGRAGRQNEIRDRVIGGAIVGILIVALLLILFSCTVDADNEGRRPPDPGPTQSEGPELPPDMDLESAFKDGYFTDPKTGDRYLVAQIDRAAKRPAGWICRPAVGLPTQQCLVKQEPVSQDPSASPTELPSAEPQDSDAEVAGSGSSWFGAFAGIGGGLGGFAAVAAVFWQVFKDRDEFREWRQSPRSG
ncbi:MAG: hypothetical protein ACRDPS_10905 [Nocardioides sp.]|uniref:hypothetical protein n=1 Tax=Nocardioides sp. TaxID=35761 RepID=UPI003D6A30D2